MASISNGPRMMTDLASPLSTTPAPLGVVANVGAGLASIAGSGMAVGGLGFSVIGTTAGHPTAFQTALAALAPAPIAAPTPLIPFASILPDPALLPPDTGATGIMAIGTAPPPATARGRFVQAPASLQPAIAAHTTPVDLLRAEAADPPVVALIGFGLVKPSATGSLSTAPLVASLAAEPDAEPDLAVTDQSLPVAERGKLPATGNILPVGAAPKTPDDAQLHAHGSDERVDDRSAQPDNSVDPIAQAVPAFAAGLVQPFAPIVPATPVSASAKAAVSTKVPLAPARTLPRLVASAEAIAQPLPAAPAPAPTVTGLNTGVAARTWPVASDAAPAPGGTASPPAAFAAALEVPVLAVAAVPTFAVAALPMDVALSVTLLPSPPDPVAGSRAATLHPVVSAIAPEISGVAPAIVTTASLLSWQAGAPLDGKAKVEKPGASASTMTTGDGAAMPNAPGNMFIMPIAAAPVASALATTTAPPQDFAALVDRLVEARAAAQTSTAPQQISAAVTHTQFGKVSLTFQHDNAGLSVSMTSADPGFASAAQTAIATSPALLAAGHAGAGAGQPGNQSSGQSGNFSQNFTVPDGRGQPTSGLSDNGNASFSTAGGGSAQSQAQAQGQRQPQTRPGAIAAARRSGPALSGAGTSDGIFA